MKDQDISYDIKTWLVVGISALITFIVVFIIFNTILNGDRGDKEKKPVKEHNYTDDVYKIGDEVSFSDGSKWNVLYPSKAGSEYVTLLSQEDVNKDNVLYSNISSYLKGTYKNGLISSLKIESSDIQDIRLLAYIDLATISKEDSNKFLPDVLIKDFNIPSFIYQSNTVTDTTYKAFEKESPIMICSKDTAEARFCLGDAGSVLPIRPVVSISKKYVEKVKEEAEETSSTEAQNIIKVE